MAPQVSETNDLGGVEHQRGHGVVDQLAIRPADSACHSCNLNLRLARLVQSPLLIPELGEVLFVVKVNISLVINPPVRQNIQVPLHVDIEQLELQGLVVPAAGAGLMLLLLHWRRLLVLGSARRENFLENFTFAA